MAEDRICDEALEATVTHFGVVLSSRSRSELDIALVDLADFCPPLWANLLRKAVESCPVGEHNKNKQYE